MSMYATSPLDLELYETWDESLARTHGSGSRDAPISLEDDSPDVKLEDLWKQQYPEIQEIDLTGEELQPATSLAPEPTTAAAPAPKPERDAFERYLKLKLRKLDKKRRQAEEQAAQCARERRDIIDSIDSIPEPDDEDAQMSVELAAWDTRVKQMVASLLAAKAGRKATRLKMDLREYRKKRDQDKARHILELFPPVEQIPDSFFVNLLN